MVSNTGFAETLMEEIGEKKVILELGEDLMIME